MDGCSARESRSGTSDGEPRADIIAQPVQEAEMDANEVRLLDADSGRILSVGLPGPLGSVSAMAVGPAGRSLVTVDTAMTVQKTPVAAGDVIQSICSKAGRMTEGEWRRQVPGLPYQQVCGSG